MPKNSTPVRILQEVMTGMRLGHPTHRTIRRILAVPVSIRFNGMPVPLDNHPGSTPPAN